VSSSSEETKEQSWLCPFTT